MAAKEAKARIKINKLLEAAGWRFFDGPSGPSNVVVEPSVKLSHTDVDALGENFEGQANGFVDFLLLDAKGHPLVVLEAESEAKHPLVGKEQARKYARSQSCRFVIEKLVAEPVENDYIALTQLPNYANEAGWKNEAETGRGETGGFYPHPAFGHLLPAREKAKLETSLFASKIVGNKKAWSTLKKDCRGQLFFVTEWLVPH